MKGSLSNSCDGSATVTPFEDPNKEIDAQIYECKNMCNFGFREIDIENDEALSHDWEAVPSVSN